jgi:membrane-bound serine protease (ClpP class)
MQRIRAGREGLVGLTAHAHNDLKPGIGGKVFVHGELWNAVSDEEILTGEKAVVEKVDGMVLKVKRINKPEV